MHILTIYAHKYTHLLDVTLPRRPLRPHQSGLDVYADLAWQQQILLCTPSSYCLLGRHGSLTHRSAAWRRIDCEHPDCPSWRGVWQSSDRHAELILQAHCLFSPALPARCSVGSILLLAWFQGPTNHPTAPSSSTHPTYSCHCTSDTDKITGCVFHSLVFYVSFFFFFFLFFLVPSYTAIRFEWQLVKRNVAQAAVPCSNNAFPSH